MRVRTSMQTGIVIPCFNESERLSVKAISAFLKSTNSVSLLFVDDGSRDDTARILQEMCAAWPDRVFAWSLSKNCGKAEAVRRGILKAIEFDYEFIGFWDADLATPLTAVPEFIRVLANRDDISVVWGSRMPLLGRLIQRTRNRFLLGRLYSKLSAIAVRTSIFDASCGAKLFRNNWNLEPIFQRPFYSRWIFDVEILSRLRHQQPQNESRTTRNNLYELPVDTWNEVPGSKIRSTTFLTAAIELLVIAFRHRFSSTYPLPPELPTISTVEMRPLAPIPSADQKPMAA